MSQIADPITFSVSRTLLHDIVTLTAEMTDRMHELLERNTEGSLTTAERTELESLTRVAEFGQVISMALHSTDIP